MNAIILFKKIFIGAVTFFSLLTVFLSTASASELYLFQTDIDNNDFDTTKIFFEVPASIYESWYPLRKAAEYLPITVDWDASTQEIVIFSNAIQMIRPLCAEQRYDRQKIETYEADIKIVDGVTYCSGKFLSQHLQGVGFLYKNSIFYYTGGVESAAYINSGDSTKFFSYINTSLYELYLKLPDDYQFITENLPGGICFVDEDDTPYDYALGYVYPYSQTPTCYIVGDRFTGATLTSIIAHEAMHVYQARMGVLSSEKAAQQYEARILDELLSRNSE